MMDGTGNRKKQGFASMSPEERSRIARMGGIAVQLKGNAHRWNSTTARAAGQKGGNRSRGGRGRIGNKQEE